MVVEHSSIWGYHMDRSNPSSPYPFSQREKGKPNYAEDAADALAPTTGKRMVKIAP